jgi:DNA-binding transcriptional ArsR family regulator
MMQPDTTVRRLSALAQTTRLAVFRRLLKRGRAGLRPQALMVELGIGGTALSFHLRALLRAGLIEGQQEQGGIRYRARPAALRELLDALAQDCCSTGEDACELDPRPRWNSADAVEDSPPSTDIQHAPT